MAYPEFDHKPALPVDLYFGGYLWKTILLNVSVHYFAFTHKRILELCPLRTDPHPAPRCQVSPRPCRAPGGFPATLATPGNTTGTDHPPTASGIMKVKSESEVAQLCPTLCDPMDCSMPGLPVHHQLPEPAGLLTGPGTSPGWARSPLDHQHCWQVFR